MSGDDTLKRFVKQVWRRAARERAKVDRIAKELRRQGPFVIDSAEFPFTRNQTGLDLRPTIQRMTGWTPPAEWDASLVSYCWRVLPILVRHTTEEQFFEVNDFEQSPRESPFDSQSDSVDFIALWEPVTARTQNQGVIKPKYFSLCLRDLSDADFDELYRRGSYDGNAIHLDKLFPSGNQTPSEAIFELSSANVTYKFSSKDWFVFLDPRVQPLGQLISGFLGRFETAGEAREYAASCRDRYGITTCTGFKKRYLRKITYRW